MLRFLSLISVYEMEIRVCLVNSHLLQFDSAWIISSKLNRIIAVHIFLTYSTPTPPNLYPAILSQFRPFIVKG